MTIKISGYNPDSMIRSEILISIGIILASSKEDKDEQCGQLYSMPIHPSHHKNYASPK